jgi:hypothetical protein
VNGETELLSNQLAAGLLARSWAHTFPEQTRSERRLTWKGYHLTAGWLWVGAGVLVLAFGVGLLSRGARACGSLNFCGDTTERTRINWRPVSGGEVALLRLRHERDVSPAPLQTRPSPDQQAHEMFFLRLTEDQHQAAAVSGRRGGDAAGTNVVCPSWLYPR